MRKSYGFIAVWAVSAASLSVADPAFAEPLTVTISRLDCTRLVRHVPDAEVSAEYQPGVDARGDPVAPADLAGANPIELPEQFTFTLEVNPLNTRDERALESRRRVLAAQVAADPDNAALRAELQALDREAARRDGHAAAATTLGVGEVTVRRDGRVYFNGQPLQDDAAWDLAVLCRGVLEDKKKP
jgi:hypothetical protein